MLAPREHSRLWMVGPERVRRVSCFLAENPNYMCLLGAGQIAFGVWLALRRCPDG